MLGRKPILAGAWGGKSPACRHEELVRQCPLLYGAGLRREPSNGHAAQSLGEVSRAGWRFHPPRQNLCARISGDYYDGVARRPENDNTTHRRGTAQHSRNPKTKFSLPIADCRLTIEKVVWQLLPVSISPPRRGNRQSKIGNSSHPGPSDDRGKSSPHEKKWKG